MMAKQVQMGDLDSFMQLVHRYAQFLRYTFDAGMQEMPLAISDSDANLEGRSLDALPRNMVVTLGKIQTFGLEWTAEFKLPLSFVVYRGLLSLRQIIPAPEIVEKLKIVRLGETNNLYDAVRHIINQTNTIRIEERHVILFNQIEKSFQEFAVQGKADGVRPILEYLQLIFENTAGGNAVLARQLISELSRDHPQAPEAIALGRALGK
jgi:hypothetical protein